MVSDFSPIESNSGLFSEVNISARFDTLFEKKTNLISIYEFFEVAANSLYTQDF